MGMGFQEGMIFALLSCDIVLCPAPQQLAVLQLLYRSTLTWASKHCCLVCCYLQGLVLPCSLSPAALCHAMLHSCCSARLLPCASATCVQHSRSSHQPAPAEANRVQKKKLWEAVQPDLKTSADKVAGYKGSVMMTSAGPVTAKTLAAANIS